MISKTAPPGSFPWKEADDMLNLLVRRAAGLVHCRTGSPEEKEFNSLASVIEAYDARRWPAGPLRMGVRAN